MSTIKPYWGAAKKPRKKGQRGLLDAAIKACGLGDCASALACLILLRKRRAAAGQMYEEAR